MRCSTTRWDRRATTGSSPPICTPTNAVSTESEAIINAALANGVPVVSAKQMLTWLDGRNQSSFGSISWAGGKLQFSISPGAGATGLRAMVPKLSANGELESVKRGTTTLPLTFQTIKGVDYAFFDAAAGSYTATYSNAAPPPPSLTTTIPASPANNNSPKISGSASAGTTVKIYAGSSCAGSPVATGTDAHLATGITVSVADDSTTTFTATATSGEATSSCSTPITYVEDSTAPQTSIESSPPVLTNSAAASFSFSGTDTGGSGVASFQCRRDGGAFATCTSPQAYSALADGSHTFEVRAIDQAGNIDATPASSTWTVDTIAPQTTIDPNPPALSNSAAASFTFSRHRHRRLGVASFQCRLDSTQAADWATCTSPQTYSALADGTHKFEVRAIDQAGNTDATPATFTWTVDTTAPNTTITQNPAALVASGAAEFKFSGDDGTGSGVASFQCRLDSTQAAAWASMHLAEELLLSRRRPP